MKANNEKIDTRLKVDKIVSTLISLRSEIADLHNSKLDEVCNTLITDTENNIGSIVADLTDLIGWARVYELECS